MKWPDDYKKIEEFADKYDVPYTELDSLVLFYLAEQKKEIGEEFKKWYLSVYMSRKRNGFEGLEEAIERITKVKV